MSTASFLTRFGRMLVPVASKHLNNAQVQHQLTTRTISSAAEFQNYLNAKVDEKRNQLEIRGVIEAVPNKMQHISIPLVWLRDHCKCEKCYNHKTFQRQTDVADLYDERGNLRYKITDVAITKDAVTVIWNDNHLSQYSTSYLCAAHTHELRYPTHQRHTKQLWNATQMRSVCDSGELNVDYEAVTDKNSRMQAITKLYKAILTHGVGLVHGVPHEDNGKATFALADLISARQHTIYGDGTVFSHEEMPKGNEDTAYTSMELRAHNDCTYYGRAPGIQVFHCLEAAPEGGESLLVDGFQAAKQLYNVNAEAFHYLCELPVPHSFRGEGVHLLNDYLTVLRVKPHRESDHELSQIRYNPYDRSSMVLQKASRGFQYQMLDFEAFYKAYHELTMKIRDENNEHWVKLMPGTTMFVDNWRVLHGRAAYTGRRCMASCYLARDEFVSKARILNVW